MKGFSGILVAGLMVVTCVFGAMAQVEAQDIPVYESLDEAIEAELEGIDFSGVMQAQ